MKLKITFIGLALSLFVITLPSCKKYEEGPAFSFKSPENRIIGKYSLEKYYINGVELNLIENNIEFYEIEYMKNGKGLKNIKTYGDIQSTEFEWEFDKKKTKIREREKGLNEQWGTWSVYFSIIKLTNNEFWIRDENSIEKQEFHFLKK